MINNPEKMQSKESIASPQQSVTTSFREGANKSLI